MIFWLLAVAVYIYVGFNVGETYGIVMLFWVPIAVCAIGGWRKQQKERRKDNPQ